jgi:hypothetical protein
MIMQLEELSLKGWQPINWLVWSPHKLESATTQNILDLRAMFKSLIMCIKVAHLIVRVNVPTYCSSLLWWHVMCYTTYLTNKHIRSSISFICIPQSHV